MKKLLFIGLVTAAMAVSGCEYSASQTTETSFGVDSNGKVETNTTTSVYTERTENGKTVNNSASVSVGSKGTSANTNKSTAEQSAEGLSFTAMDADLRKGEAELVGYFSNSGTQPIKVNKVTLHITFSDVKGKIIWEDESEMDNINLTVAPGKKESATFTIKNPQAPAYSGDFDVTFNMDYSS